MNKKKKIFLCHGPFHITAILILILVFAYKQPLTKPITITLYHAPKTSLTHNALPVPHFTKIHSRSSKVQRIYK